MQAYQAAPLLDLMDDEIAYEALPVLLGYLAFVLTDVGWPIILFTVVEGLMCARSG